jgi:hypothetical protein
MGGYFPATFASPLRRFVGVHNRGGVVSPLPAALVGFDLNQHTSLCDPFTSAR